MSFCAACGTSNADESRFCAKCGGPLEVPQPVSAPQEVQQVAEHAKQAVVSAGKAARRLNPVLLIGAGALVLILLVGFLAFLRPMSESDYEDAADEYAADLMDAQEEWQTAIGDYAYSDYPDEELTKSDLDDLRDVYNESADAIKKAARDINGLRPPREYKSADGRLNDWADWMSGGYLEAADKMLSKQEVGRSYGRFSDDVSEYYDDISKDETRAWRAFNRAADDLGLEYGDY